MPQTRWLTCVAILLALAAVVGGLKCWQCGQYSDGVGSITPCTNHTLAKLNDCPAQARYCIKYVSELTIVRDCVPTCNEKESWGAHSYCCDTDECNAAFKNSPTAAFIPALLLTAAAAR